MPGNRWLGCKARTCYEEGKPLADSAWIVSEQGKVLSSGNMGDALSCPTVAQDGTIWAPYFDEHPVRDDDPVDESSDYGKYTAGDSGMTVFDDHLKVLARHNSPTYVMDVYYSHHDGHSYWYLSYPDWIIDNWSTSGQGEPMAANDELELRGVPFLMYKNRLARLSVFEVEWTRRRRPLDEHVSLYRYPQRSDIASVSRDKVQQTLLTYPNGLQASMDVLVCSWSNKFYLIDKDTSWYEIEAFPS
ncbi:hypothetical protein KIM372_08210 [Bombiscardovia nodaiensis]|uniref:Uncharacterized protein n=1 Tax=Bombiscardovia nodaiensis TaxID=2932181 RepID=A0ABM8B7R1_9BIFI|nr:hypothetical protein KIM372_08210 [Bombiscardovia nodaiensis]